MEITNEKLTRIYYSDTAGNKWIPPLHDPHAGIEDLEPPDKSTMKYMVSAFPLQLEETHLRLGYDGEGHRFSVEVARGTSGVPEDLVLSLVGAHGLGAGNKALRRWSLGDAIMIAAIACERCLNVLAHEYLGNGEGYPEGSPEWQESRTECRFCQEGDWLAADRPDEDVEEGYDEPTALPTDGHPAAPPIPNPVVEPATLYLLVPTTNIEAFWISDSYAHLPVYEIRHMPAAGYGPGTPVVARDRAGGRVTGTIKRVRQQPDGGAPIVELEDARLYAASPEDE